MKRTKALSWLTPKINKMTIYSVLLEILALLGASGLVFNVDNRVLLEISEAHVFLFVQEAEDI